LTLLDIIIIIIIIIINRSVKFQHVPTCRDGKGRLSREVDDIFLLFSQLDENKMFDNLPRYVASGPDNMPTSRIFEGDLKTFLKRLEDMSGQIAECKAGMLALSRDVSSLQIAARSAPESSITPRPVASESSVLPPTCDQQQWPALAPRRSAVDSGNYGETESRSVINQLPAKHQIGPLLHRHLLYMATGLLHWLQVQQATILTLRVFNLLVQNDLSVGVLELELQFGNSCSSSAVWLQLLVVKHLVTLAGVTVGLVAH